MIGLRSLLRRRTTATNDAPRAAGEAPPLAVPAYYEVWGGLESANRALWIAVWFAGTTAFLALILLKVQLGRPPVVIGLDGEGRAHSLTDASAQPPAGEAEVKNFLTLFERFFTELNCYTADADLQRAFAMMTREFQAKAADMLRRDGTVDKLKADQGKTTLILTEITIARDTPQILDCHVKGYREIGSYKPDGTRSEVVFEDDVVLRKMARSEQAPSGLLVEDFNESLFKK